LQQQWRLFAVMRPIFLTTNFFQMRTTEKNTPAWAVELPAPCYPPRCAEEVYANLLTTDAPQAHLENLHELFCEWVGTVPEMDFKERTEAYFTYITLRDFLLNSPCCPSVGMVSSNLALGGQAHLRTFDAMFIQVIVITHLGPDGRQRLYNTYHALRQAIADAITLFAPPNAATAIQQAA